MPLEYFIFGLLLVGIVLFHHRTFEVAAAGTVVLIVYKVFWTQVDLLGHLAHESRLLINLLGLLLGFALLAKHFEESHLPSWIPDRLPSGWKGGFLLLWIVASISMFLDNIAAAMIGGVIARRMYQHRVCLSFIIALVAASNAGGAGSVIGDTTTTMMWIAGVPAIVFLKAFIGSVTAILSSGIIASRKQHNFQAIVKSAGQIIQIDVIRLCIVAIIVLGTIWANVTLDFPAIGLWAGILLGAFIRPTQWSELRHALKGSFFLILLVVSASLMPVESLPTPTWATTLGLGFLSAVFDNIPLTALAIFQGGYDWAVLAYTVGYGGSLIWFGSSAGVAITNIFPQAKNSLDWLKEGWHVAFGYVLGFFLMLFLGGWRP
jgi:Na+/H+ antiporter NhaD/arsenite permease-like protein